jgi:hypothetical protein
MVYALASFSSQDPSHDQLWVPPANLCGSRTLASRLLPDDSSILHSLITTQALFALLLWAPRGTETLRIDSRVREY